MFDSAILGNYASEKLIINSFSIDKKNNKNIVQAQRRKVIGITRQELLITLQGYLVCSSFDELEAELDALQEALYKPELKLLIGNRPDMYYNVVWDGSSMPRKPQNGGYVLPISLNFTGLEESAISAIPATIGLKYIPEVSYFVNQEGNKFAGPQYVFNPKTVFMKFTPNAGFEDFILGDSTFGIAIGYKPTYAVNKVVFSLYIGGVQVFFKNIPDFGTYTVGFVRTPSGAIVYINGVHYDYYGVIPDANFTVYPNPSVLTEWAIVAKYSAPRAFVNQVLNVATGNNIIKSVYVNSLSTIISYAGNYVSYASLITIGSVNASNFTMNDFGAGHTSPLLGYFTFNGMSTDIIVQWTSETGNVVYTGKTLFPYLNRGTNILTKSSDNNALLVWFDRWI